MTGSRIDTGYHVPDVIVCGHTRLLAARQLRLKEVPFPVATGLTPEQLRAYTLMDNRSHEEALWDLEGLSAELLALQGLEFDLSLTGLDMSELDRLLPHATEGEHRVPPTPEHPGSRPGDLWLFGNHRQHSQFSGQRRQRQSPFCGRS